MAFAKASEKSREYISSPHVPEPVASKFLVWMTPHSTPWLQTIELIKHVLGFSDNYCCGIFFLPSFFTYMLLIKLCAVQVLTLKKLLVLMTSINVLVWPMHLNTTSLIFTPPLTALLVIRMISDINVSGCKMQYYLSSNYCCISPCNKIKYMWQCICQSCKYHRPK